MIMKLKWFSCLLVINAIMGGPVSMFTDAYAQGLESSLNWEIEASKKTYYPGEAVLLTLNISNTGDQEIEINFGAEGIEAIASMEIRNSSGKIVAKGGQIRRAGVARPGFFTVASGKTSRRPIVLNQWCSTRLTPGQYHVACRVEYRFPSERRKLPNTKTPKAGPIHTVELELDIQIVSANSPKLEAILEGLAKRAFKKNPSVFEEPAVWKKALADRRIAKEMLAFTESTLAVPYQLQVLKNARSTWLEWGVINSLVKSKSLDAASGLMQIIESPRCREHRKRQAIDAVYRLRETGKSDIVNATNDFVAKYKRPVIVENMCQYPIL